MRECKVCHELKPKSGFESKNNSPVRRTCISCYNKRRAEIQGGALREAEKRRLRTEEIINSIDGCSLIGVYSDPRKNGAGRRIKLLYKGFEWDIRYSNFLAGKRPWSMYSHKDYQRGFFVYKFLGDSGEALYIGKTKRFAQRMSKHFSSYEVYKLGQTWKKEVKKVMVATFETESDMHIAEMYLINTESPRYNKDAISSDRVTLSVSGIPDFKEIWVAQVYERTDH